MNQAQLAKKSRFLILDAGYIIVKMERGHIEVSLLCWGCSERGNIFICKKTLMGPRPGASEYKWSAADYSHLFTIQSSSMEWCTVKQEKTSCHYSILLPCSLQAWIDVQYSKAGKTSCHFVAYIFLFTSNNPSFASLAPTQHRLIEVMRVIPACTAKTKICHPVACTEDRIGARDVFPHYTADTYLFIPPQPM